MLAREILNNEINIFLFIFSDSVFSCQVNLPQYDTYDEFCTTQRSEAILKERNYWKLTNPKAPKDGNLNNQLLIPKLNQSDTTISMKAKFDSVDKGWFSIYFTGLDIISKTSESLIKSGFLNYSLTSYNEYKVPYEQTKNSLNVSSNIFLE